MQKFGIFLISLMVLGNTAWAKSFDDFTERAILQETTIHSEQINVTDTNTTVTFPWTTKAIYIHNTGTTNELYYDPRDGVATAGTDNEDKIEADRDRSLAGFKTVAIGVIASSGESTTATVTGIR